MKTKGETMKWLDTRLFCTIVCLGSLPLSAPAAEADAAAQPPARVSPDAAARDREIAIELSEEPLEMELFRPDPELLKQQFAAVVEVFIPSHTDRRIPDRLRELAVFRGQSLLYFGSIQMSFGSQDDRPMTPADSFQRLVQEAGNSSDEGGEGLAFLLSEAVNEGYLSSGLSSPAELHGISGGYYEFRILAPSADHARERAEALARLLDRAIAVPLQQELRMQREQQEETIELLRKQLAEAQQRAEQTEEQYQKVAETAVGRDELNQLKTERRLLDVELAGIRARIETAEEILAKLKELQKAGRPADARILKVEDLKITAEIDLAGLAGRRKLLDQLIEEGNRRAELISQRFGQNNTVEELRRRLDDVQRQLGGLQSVMDNYSPLYSLKNDKIVIRPIKWTE